MKNTRRILVLLLTLTLLFSCFAIVSSAYEANEQNYDDVLEFYETAEYVNADFNGLGGKSYTEAFANVHTGFTVNAAASAPVVVSDGTLGDYLHIVHKAETSFTVTPTVGSGYGMNFALYFPQTKDPVSKLQLDAIVCGETSDKDVTKSLFIVSGTSLKAWNGLNDQLQDTFVELTALSAGVYYDFAVFCDESSNATKITISVTNRSTGETETAPEFMVEGFNVDKLNLKFSISQKRQGPKVTNANTYVDYIDCYEGSFPRSQATKDVTVAQYIKEIYALYNENTEAEYAASIINVIGKVAATHGYTTANVADADLKAAADAAITDALGKQGNAYADLLVEEIANVDPVNDTYNQRLNKANTLDVYAEFVNWVLENRTDIAITQTPDAIAAATAALNTEIETLAKLEADTLACIEAVSTIEDPNLADYKTLYGVNDTVINHPVCVTYTSDTVTQEIVEAAARAAEIIKLRFAVLDANAKEFVENVRIARDRENKTFLERYNAYMLIRDIAFVDTSYDEFIEGGVDTVESLNADFALIDAEMSAAIELATEFISKITTAESSNSFNVKADALNEATAIMESADFANIDGENGYPGIVAAKAKHADLLTAITTSENSAKAYIEAVIAIKNATSFADKKAKIEAAKALSAGVDNVTINVFVTENISETETKQVDVKDANIRLSAAVAEVKLVELNAANFKSAIAAYKAAKTTADRRAALIQANALMQVANDVIDGVAEAKTECAKLIADFNAEVTAANTVAAKTNSIAANVSEAAMSAVSGSKIVAIIKKFYE